MAIDFHPGLAQCANFLQKGERIEHHAVADNAAAARAQHATGHQLQNKFLAVDDDGVAGIVAPGIAGDDGEVLRQDVDDLPLALIAPLGANNHGGLAFFHSISEQAKFEQADGCSAPGFAHSLPAGIPGPKILGIDRRRCVRVILSCQCGRWQRAGRNAKEQP